MRKNNKRKKKLNANFNKRFDFNLLAIWSPQVFVEITFNAKKVAYYLFSFVSYFSKNEFRTIDVGVFNDIPMIA